MVSCPAAYVAQVCNPPTQEAEVGELTGAQANLSKSKTLSQKTNKLGQGEGSVGKGACC